MPLAISRWDKIPGAGLILSLVLISAGLCSHPKGEFIECRFESWVGQESKLLAAGYISTKAGGPKKAIFDKEAQAKIGKVQEVSHFCLQQSCYTCFQRI